MIRAFGGFSKSGLWFCAKLMFPPNQSKICKAQKTFLHLIFTQFNRLMSQMSCKLTDAVFRKRWRIAKGAKYDTFYISCIPLSWFLFVICFATEFFFFTLILSTTCTKCHSCTYIRFRNKTPTIHFRKERGKETHYSNYFEDPDKY